MSVLVNRWLESYLVCLLGKIEAKRVVDESSHRELTLPKVRGVLSTQLRESTSLAREIKESPNAKNDTNN